LDKNTTFVLVKSVLFVEKIGYNETMSERISHPSELETYQIPLPAPELSRAHEAKVAEPPAEPKSHNRVERLEQLKIDLLRAYQTGRPKNKAEAKTRATETANDQATPAQPETTAQSETADDQEPAPTEDHNFENQPSETATAPTETPTPKSKTTEIIDTTTNATKIARLKKDHLVDTVKSGGILLSSAVPLAGLSLSGAAIGATGIGTTLGFAVALPIFVAGAYRLGLNAISYRPQNTHTWVRNRSHRLEQGLFEALSSARNLPPRRLPTAVLTELLNLSLNLPSADQKGRPITYKMHTHEGISSNLERLEELGLIDITKKSELTSFKRPLKSRLILEKLTTGAAKIRDLFNPTSYTADGVLKPVKIHDIHFTVNPNQRLTSADLAAPHNRTLKLLKSLHQKGELDVSYDTDGNLQYVNVNKKPRDS
jgi:hypothetical protein